MFGYKKKVTKQEFKEAIKELEEKFCKLLKERDQDIFQLTKKLWAIENPPKHKVGDKTKEGIVSVVFLHVNYSYGRGFIKSFEWRYEYLNKNKLPIL